MAGNAKIISPKSPMNRIIDDNSIIIARYSPFVTQGIQKELSKEGGMPDNI